MFLLAAVVAGCSDAGSAADATANLGGATGHVCPASDVAQNHHGQRYLPPVCTTTGIVSAMTTEGAQAGVEILEQGGNAMDAAIAAAFADGVALPSHCGLGAAGFLVHRSSDGNVRALDFGASESWNSSPDFYLDGRAGMYGREFAGHRGIGLPGFVAGMSAAHNELGSGMPWDQLLAPAQALASEGVVVSPGLAFHMAISATKLGYFPEAAEAYLVGGVAPYPPGATLFQPKYAHDLGRIARDPRSMYDGEIAAALERDMQAAGQTTDLNPRVRAFYPMGSLDAGIISKQDLATYEALWRDPLVKPYRDAEVITLGAPTGGVAIQQMLGILQHFPLGASQGDALPGDPGNDMDWRVLSANAYHVMAEAERIAWGDRYDTIGDPDYVNVQQERLLSPGHLRRQADSIEWTARPAPKVEPGGNGTCTLAVIDGAGNAVSMTHTIGDSFGSGVMAPDTGFILNNQADWSWCCNWTVADGPSGSEPGKRVPTSNSPAIVVRNGVTVLATGGAGGVLIPMAVLQSIVNVVDFHMNVAEALDAPRIEAVHAHKYEDAPSPVGKPEKCTGRLAIEATDTQEIYPRPPPRVTNETQDDLAQRGGGNPQAVLCRPDAGPNFVNGFDDYWSPTVILRAVGIDPSTGARHGAGDPREHQLFPEPTYRHLGVAGQSASQSTTNEPATLLDQPLPMLLAGG